MPEGTLRGRFVWHELMANDVKSAAAFYTKVAGWKPRAWQEDASYTELLAGKRGAAGLMKLPDDAKAMGAPPSWLMYVGTPDVDAAAREAASLGGKVLKAPADIPTVGRFAVLQDPQGAVFAAFTPKGATTPDAPAAVGQFSWHELATTDAAGAVTFYKNLFGWDKTSEFPMGPGSVYHLISIEGRQQAGMFDKPKEMPGPPAWLSYIRVPDAKKSAEAIKKAGGTVINGPMEVPGGDWITQALDPQGVMFAVHSLKAAAPAKPKAATRKPAAKPRKAAKSKKAAKPKRAAKRAAPQRRLAKKAGARKRRR
jgi:uncharacterized protein